MLWRRSRGIKNECQEYFGKEKRVHDCAVGNRSDCLPSARLRIFDGVHAGITRLDDEGYLYYMDYTKDYYGKDVMDAMRKVGFII